MVDIFALVSTFFGIATSLGFGVVQLNAGLVHLGILRESSFLFQALITFFNTNVLRYVILAGTFSLAFAFAGNDLVNFVGVPLAALDSCTSSARRPAPTPPSSRWKSSRTSPRRRAGSSLRVS